MINTGKNEAHTQLTSSHFCVCIFFWYISNKNEQSTHLKQHQQNEGIFFPNTNNMLSIRCGSV